MRIFKTILLLLFFTTLAGSSSAQEYYKIECDILIKEKDSSGLSLLKGNLVFDKFKQVTEVDFTFPKKERWIISHDSLVKMVNGIEVYRHYFAHINHFSIFNLFLNGNLKHFGLKNSKYKATQVEVLDDEVVMTTWEPPEDDHFEFGKVISRREKGKLQAVALYDKEERILGELFFRNYVDLKGFDFPSEMLQVSYENGIEQKKLFTYENLVLH